MTKTRSICKRCHRLRVVSSARYCATCESHLRADERPRAQPDTVPAPADPDAELPDAG